MTETQAAQGVENRAEQNDTSRWRRLSPAAILYFALIFVKNLVQHGWQGLAPLAAIIVAKGGVNGWLGIIIAGIAISVMVSSVLSYLYFRFMMTDTAFLIRRGVINKKQLHLAFARIQNIQIKQPIYFRPLGLAVLTLESAGSASEEVSLAGIPIALARKIRVDVAASKKSAVSDVAGADAEPQAHMVDDTEELLARQDLKSLIKYGLSNNSVWIFAGLAAPLLNQLGDDWDWILSDEIQAVGAQIKAMGPIAVAASLSAMGVALILLLMAVSVAASIVIYFGYRLSRSEGRIHRENGLLERQQASMEEAKIQRILVRQSLIGRLVGCFTLSFKQIGFNMGVEGRDKSFIVPCLDQSGYQALIARLYPDFDGRALATQGIDVMYLQRLILFAAIPVSILALTGASLWGAKGLLPLLALVALIPLLILKKHRYRYGLRDGYAFMQSGLFGRNMSIFPIYKVQTVSLSQTPAQRRKKLATLEVNIAGTGLTMPYMPLQDARHWQNHILYSVESSRKDWM